MDLSWAAIFVFPTLLTPAFVMLWVFRFFFPKGKFVNHSDVFLILMLVLVGAALNVDLLDRLMKLIYTSYFIQSLNEPIHRIFMQFIYPANPAAYFPWNVFHWLEDLILSHPQSAWGFLFRIHLRPLWFSLIVFGGIQGIELLNDTYEAKQFTKRNRETSRRSINTDSKVGFLLNWLHNLISHSWVIHTRHNKKIETLMADILTEDGNLYMGRLANYETASESISSLSLVNIFRFYPDEASKPSSSTSSQESKTEKPADFPSPSKSLRKQRLVNNSGEMIFPYSTIKTIHLWNLKLGTELRVNVFDKNSEEWLKWNMSLVSDSPDIFKNIAIFVSYKTQKEVDKFKEEFRYWYKQNGISIPKSKIKIDYLPIP